MQHNKNTKKPEQIAKVSTSEKKISESIWTVMDKFNIKTVLTPFNVLKRSGALVSTITMSLIVLPFIAKDSVWALFAGNLYKDNSGKKDAFYDLKNNSTINWRLLLYGMARRFQVLLSPSSNNLNGLIRALILDDTAISKTGKSIERTGYVHDHVSGTFILGYKILVVGYWDGVSFIPIDFSIHREKRDDKLNKSKKQIEKTKNKIVKLQDRKTHINNRIKVLKKEMNLLNKAIKIKPQKTKEKQLMTKTQSLGKHKKRMTVVKQDIEEEQQKLQYQLNAHSEVEKHSGRCGLKPQEYKDQFKKHRERETPGNKRIKETDKSKIDNAVVMIKRALRAGFKFEYVLTDSWFFSGKLLQGIVSFGKEVNLISMAKIGNARYKMLPSDKYLSPKQLIANHKYKAITNRKYKAKYIKIQAEYQGVRVVMFLIKIGRGENWRLLVSTDLNISFNKLMEVYKIRWAIEVFFKESKQYLLLGKSQSQDFDAQIADTTISFMRYILLSYYERIYYGISIGGMFRELSQASVEENLVADLSDTFMVLLQAFANLSGIDFITFYESIIRQPELQTAMVRLQIAPPNKAA